VREVSCERGARWEEEKQGRKRGGGSKEAEGAAEEKERGREGKGREGKGRKGREGKGREGKGREGKGDTRQQCATMRYTHTTHYPLPLHIASSAPQ
jgi:hypothetical protein